MNILAQARESRLPLRGSVSLLTMGRPAIADLIPSRNNFFEHAGFLLETKATYTDLNDRPSL